MKISKKDREQIKSRLMTVANLPEHSDVVFNIINETEKKIIRKYRWEIKNNRLSFKRTDFLSLSMSAGGYINYKFKKSSIEQFVEDLFSTDTKTIHDLLVSIDEYIVEHI